MGIVQDLSPCKRVWTTQTMLANYDRKQTLSGSVSQWHSLRLLAGGFPSSVGVVSLLNTSDRELSSLLGEDNSFPGFSNISRYSCVQVSCCGLLSAWFEEMPAMKIITKLCWFQTTESGGAPFSRPCLRSKASSVVKGPHVQSVDCRFEAHFRQGCFLGTGL